jgi:hypothetical protein
MEDFYCLNLRFKDDKISSKTFHTHLYVSNDEMYFKIIDNDSNSIVDRLFSRSQNPFGLFEDNFEVTETDISMLFDSSRIYRMTSFQTDFENTFFIIYVSKIALIFPNKHRDSVSEGKAFLNKNGLSLVNSFYSFFTNLTDKNKFTISRMNGMQEFYKYKQILFKPELEFSNNEKRGSEEFTVKKIPTINYQFQDLKFEEVKRSLEIICNFISFCFGVRIFLEKMTYFTKDEVFIYRDNSPNNKTFVSDFSSVFFYLRHKSNLNELLKTDWCSNYLKQEKKIDKAIDNYLHSREVNLSASFLLLFNIIEIFNVQKKSEKFTFNDSKEKIFSEAFELLATSLQDNNDIALFKSKWNGVINKIEMKPLKSPLEETLIRNGISPENCEFQFVKLKNTRDKLTHGSVSSIKEEDLKLQVICLRKIASLLILANLGFMSDFKTR